MSDVMLDFETLGTGKNAAIIQVGACYFNRRTGEIGGQFKMNIDARSAVASGAEIDADTVYWWLSQSREAIDSVTKGELFEIRTVMTLLNEYLGNAGCIWSHSTFDFVILEQTLKRLRFKPSFSYRAARDIRTLLDLSGVSTTDFIRIGTPHDALEDCRFQVQYCVAALNKLANR